MVAVGTSMLPEITIATIFVAAIYDFVNGFHDASNSIATIVATKVLKPRQAVLWAACFNFLALIVFDTTVAKTVGSGLVNLDMINPSVIICGLGGAIAWGVLSWLYGIPTSSSHALVGGYAGAAMWHVAMARGIDHMFAPILWPGWT